jgi:hypothetical protein
VEHVVGHPSTLGIRVDIEVVGTPLKYKVILGAVALAVVGVLVIFGQEPSDSVPRDTCRSKGIDPEVLKEGTCYNGEQEVVVVNGGHRLRSSQSSPAKPRGEP